MSAEWVLPEKVSGPAVELLLSGLAAQIARLVHCLPAHARSGEEENLTRTLGYLRTHPQLSTDDRQELVDLTVYFRTQLTSPVIEFLRNDDLRE